MDTRTLIEQAHQGDKVSRDKLLIENTGLIWSVVRRFLNRGYEKEELFQVGCIGMLKAIDRFDTGLEVAFSTYAVPMIMGEIRRFLRDDGMIKISRKIKENQLKIIVCSEKFRNEFEREPTLEELEKYCELGKEDIVTAMDASKEVESIDREINMADGSTKSVLDTIESPKTPQHDIFNRLLVRQLLDTLNNKEQKIIMLRYFQNKTQTQIASIMGMSQVQISRMEKKILSSLKRKME